jgi:hypothetical protein
MPSLMVGIENVPTLQASEYIYLPIFQARLI